MIVVPLKPGKLASPNVLPLGEDLALFMRNFTGRGYDVSRESFATGDSRLSANRVTRHSGLKLFVDGNRILIGRVAILEDETIFRSYIRHLKSLTQDEVEKPKVKIDLPDGFTFEPRSRRKRNRKEHDRELQPTCW